MKESTETEAGTETNDSAPASRSLVLAALAVGFIIALSLSELVVRVALPPPALYQGHPANVPGLVSPEPVRGYSWSPGFDGRMVAPDYDNRYLISAQGLRDDTVLEDGKRRILVVGDSFTGGEGVEADETWPKRLQVALNGSASAPLRVINAGVTGYGARQMRQAAEAYVPQFRPEHVIIGVYPHGADRVNNPFTLFGEHLVRKREIPNMEQRPDGYIWYHSGFSNRWLAGLDTWTQRHFYFGAYVMRLVNRVAGMVGEPAKAAADADRPPVDTRLGPVFAELSLLKEFLEERNIGLTVFVISGQSSAGEFTQDTRAMAAGVVDYCNSLGLPVVDPLAILESEAAGKPVFRFPNDGHWTASAHDIAARYLADHLELQSP